ncbi:hypothetical protein KKB40_05195 [Patescibacteria group bacterium]|nr:hypothetical protein [Patescibacteria group bacterium]
MIEEPVEIQPKSQREELLKQLSPKEAAMFRFLEHLVELEETPREYDEPGVKVSWDYGFSTRSKVDGILEGDTYKIPLPHEGKYITFGWIIGYDYFEPEMKKKYPKYKDFADACPSKGSSDIRIFDLGNHLSLQANIGRLEGMEQELKDAFDEEPYPVKVEDREGFEYFNPAYEAHGK